MVQKTTRRQVLTGVATACGGAVTGQAVARESTRTPASTRAVSSGDEADDIAVAVRGAVSDAVREHTVDGATVAVVDDGETALRDGFGHAYLNPDVPVSPESTLFRIGSVSKVFPYVAALRLADQGHIEPHAPIHEALDSVSVPNPGAYDESVTLAHLATHTSGFGESSAGQFRRSPDVLRSLPAALNVNDPERIHPPGAVPMYTNYNAGLTGQLVADVNGTDFADAMQALVFDPLGMTESTFDPLPPALVGGRTDAAAEINWYSEMTPASGMSATASDMARFLRAVAGDGTVDGDRILSPKTVEALHRQWDTPHERLAGASFGMERERRDGTLVVGHQGGIPDFATDLLVVPESGIGLFVSVHGDDADEARDAVSDAFLDHVAPVSEPPAPDDAPTRADDLRGTYRETIVADAASFEKALAPIKGGTLSVRVADTGHLVTERWRTTHRWVEVAPLVFRRVDGADTLLFSEIGGELSLFRATAPRVAFESVPWYGQTSLHGDLALAAGLVVLSGAVGWPLAAGWRYARGGQAPTPAVSHVRWTAGGSVLSLLGFGLLAVIGVVAGWLYARPPWFPLVFTLPLVGAGLTLGAAGFVVQAWRRGDSSLLSRVHAATVVAGMAVLYGVLWYWNLLQLP